MINNLLLVVSPRPKLCFARTSKFNFDGVHFNANLSKRRRLALRPRAFPKFTLSSSLQTETDLENAAFQAPKNNNSPILLDVTGMMCGACVSRVKSILSADERVESAVVNMLTETAAVKLKSEALLVGEVSASIGESLAKRLSECGFEAKKRVSGSGVTENVKKWKDMVKKKEELIVKSRNRVVFAWTLVALCCGSHASHILHSLGIHVGHGSVLEVLHNSYVKGGLALGSLLGPGRDLLVDGLRAFKKGSPNMNSLVGFGSIAAFIISAISLLNPALEWDASFFDEPCAGHASWFCASRTFS